MPHWQLGRLQIGPCRCCSLKRVACGLGVLAVEVKPLRPEGGAAEMRDQ